MGGLETSRQTGKLACILRGHCFYFICAPNVIPHTLVAGPRTGPSRSSVSIPPPKAQEFLAKLSRTKRNIWDRSRPDVQQWIQQFMYLGFDEQVGDRISKGGGGVIDFPVIEIFVLVLCGKIRSQKNCFTYETWSS